MQVNSDETLPEVIPAANAAPTKPPKKRSAHLATKKSHESSVDESSGNRTIQSLTTDLPEEQKSTILALLEQIPEVYKFYWLRHQELGELLFKLQQQFANAGAKGRFNRCLRYLHIPKSTAYDLIKRYGAVKDLPDLIRQAAEEAVIDLGAAKCRSRLGELRFKRQGLTLQEAKDAIDSWKKPKREARAKFGTGITKKEQKQFKVFDALRKAMSNLPAIEKKEYLQKGLNFWAHYCGEYTGPTTITLTPTKAEDDWVLHPEGGKSSRQEVAE